MERVSQEEVIESWLRKELEKHNETISNLDEMSESKKLAKLQEKEPETAGFFLEESFEWYKTELSEKEFRQLYSVWANYDIPDHTIDKLGKQLQNPDSKVSKTLNKEGVGTDHIRELANNLPEETPKHPIIVTVNGLKSPRVRDGCHRAMSVSLHMAEGRKYQELEAYIGFSTPRKLKSFTLRFRKGMLSRFDKLV
ncbi:MAG: hypothetical protein ABEJ95_01565 [Candidatus Nanohalobium sp.]